MGAVISLVVTVKGFEDLFPVLKHCVTQADVLDPVRAFLRVEYSMGPNKDTLMYPFFCG